MLNLISRKASTFHFIAVNAYEAKTGYVSLHEMAFISNLCSIPCYGFNASRMQERRCSELDSSMPCCGAYTRLTSFEVLSAQYGFSVPVLSTRADCRVSTEHECLVTHAHSGWAGRGFGQNWAAEHC